MNLKIYRPKIDKMFWSLSIPTNLLCVAILVIPSISDAQVLFVTIPIVLFCNYFLVSPLFGYVKLCENELFIKYGFFLKKHIAYEKIRSLEKGRRFYSYSMLSLKNAFDHVDIKYNFYDVTTVSVNDLEEFIIELNERIRIAKEAIKISDIKKR